MEEPMAIVKSEDLPATNDLEQWDELSTNWRITEDNKRLSDAISTIFESKVTERLTFDDIVCGSSLVLQPVNANILSTFDSTSNIYAESPGGHQDACTIDINLLPGQRISRIGIVSEGSVFEFFGESGEYAGTAFAEFIEEFEEATVYLAEYKFEKPTSQASIKFTRIHNSRSDMYLYGIKLVLADAKSSRNDRSMFEDILRSSRRNDKQMPKTNPDFKNIPDYDGNFKPDFQAFVKSFMGIAPWDSRPDEPIKRETAIITGAEKKEPTIESSETEKKSNIDRSMDEKLRDMEKRLLRRIDEAETRINDKLDVILKQLELRNTAL